MEEFLNHSDCTNSIRTDTFRLFGPPCQRKDMVFDDTLSSTSQSIAQVYYLCSELQNHMHAVAQLELEGFIFRTHSIAELKPNL